MHLCVCSGQASLGVMGEAWSASPVPKPAPAFTAHAPSPFKPSGTEGDELVSRGHVDRAFVALHDKMLECKGEWEVGWIWPVCALHIFASSASATARFECGLACASLLLLPTPDTISYVV